MDPGRRGSGVGRRRGAGRRAPSGARSRPRRGGTVARGRERRASGRAAARRVRRRHPLSIRARPRPARTSLEDPRRGERAEHVGRAPTRAIGDPGARNRRNPEPLTRRDDRAGASASSAPSARGADDLILLGKFDVDPRKKIFHPPRAPLYELAGTHLLKTRNPYQVSKARRFFRSRAPKFARFASCMHVSAPPPTPGEISLLRLGKNKTRPPPARHSAPALPMAARSTRAGGRTLEQAGHAAWLATEKVVRARGPPAPARVPSPRASPRPAPLRSRPGIRRACAPSLAHRPPPPPPVVPRPPSPLSSRRTLSCSR